MKDHTLNVPFKTVFLTLISLGGVYLLYQMSDVVLTIALAIVIVLSIEPLVKDLIKFKFFGRNFFTRTSAVLTSYVLIFTTIFFTFYFALPEVVNEFPKMLLIIEKIFEENAVKYGIGANVIPDLSQYAERAISISINFFSNIFSLLSLILLSLYISLDWEKIKKFFTKVIPNGGGEIFEKIVRDLEIYIGYWVKGQLLLMFCIGFCSSVALFFLGNPFYISLGLIAAFLEIVPIIGPIISTVLAGIVALAFSGQNIAIITVIIFYGIQLLENNFLVPKVMQKVSGFSPVLILLSFLICSNFLGLPGAILAVPILMFGNILIKFLLLPKNNQ
jgi:predicted PurR-regulated permease PerM